MRTQGMVWAVMVLLLAGTVAVVWGDEEKSEPQTVTLRGEIVEAGCFLERGQRAADNPRCIKRCASNGMPMALVTVEDEVYLILRSHEQMDAYDTAKSLAAEKVEVVGFVHERGGLRGVLVTSVRRLDNEDSTM